VTPADAQVLLGMAATYDQRKPDADVAKGWAAALNGLRFEDCRLAIIEHFATTAGVYLMPGHIRAIVKRLRAARIAAHPPVIPPPDLTIAQERQWRLEINARIGDGEQIDPDYAYAGQLKARDLRELTARPDNAEPMRNLRAEADQARRKTQEARPMKDDQRKRQRAEAEAELAGLRDRLAKGADEEGVA
jgi:hypothetical protein